MEAGQTPPADESMQVAPTQRRGLEERLRRRREAIGAQDRSIDLDVPGYGGDLLVRYGMIEGGWDVIKKIGERVQKSKNPRAELLAACDTLVFACKGIYVRQDSGAIEPLDDPAAEAAPTFGEPDRIGSVLGFSSRDAQQNPITARQCVLRMFNNELAVQAQYVELSQWLQDANTEDDGEFLGESEGSRR